MRKKGLKKNGVVFSLLVFISLLLLFLEQKGQLAPIRAVLERPVLAIEKRIYSLKTSASQSLNFFSYWRNGEKELMLLRGQLKQLALDNGRLSACLEENQKMRSLLGAPLPPQWKFLPAEVVGAAHNLRLNKGYRHGVREGMVVVSDNLLVGKVVSVEETSALVQLPVDPAAKIPVVVKKPASAGVQARGLLTSQGSDLILDRVLQNEDIKPGDLVFTNGEGWLFHLLIGRIEEVFPKTAAVYQRARVLPLLDYQKLRIVFVVIAH